MKRTKLLENTALLRRRFGRTGCRAGGLRRQPGHAHTAAPTNGPRSGSPPPLRLRRPVAALGNQRCRSRTTYAGQRAGLSRDGRSHGCGDAGDNAGRTVAPPLLISPSTIGPPRAARWCGCSRTRPRWTPTWRET